MDVSLLSDMIYMYSHIFTVHFEGQDFLLKFDYQIPLKNYFSHSSVSNTEQYLLGF